MEVHITTVTGASSSGKDHLCQEIKTSIEHLSQFKSNVDFHIVSVDMFYKELNLEDGELADKGEYNFDTPDAIDKKLLYNVISSIMDTTAESYVVPIYSFVKNKRIGESKIYLNKNCHRRVIIVNNP